MLNNLYYGDSVDRNLKGRPVNIPKGRYVTLYGDLHPDELTPQTLKLGLLRRCIIVKKDYKDIDTGLVNKAYDKENNEWFNDVIVHYKYIISDAVVALYLKKFPTKYKVSEQALELLKELRPKGSKRIKVKETPRYPTENSELVLRVAINMMLFGFAVWLSEKNNETKKLKHLVVDARHIEWTLDFLSRTLENYKKEIARIEEPDFVKKSEKVFNFIRSKNSVKRSQIVSNFSWLRNKKNKELDDILDYLEKRELIEVSEKQDANHIWKEYSPYISDDQ